MSGICDTCQRLKRMGCGLVTDGLKSCDLYEHESRYDRLFGTPERAADMIADRCFGDDGFCPHCPMFDECPPRLHNSGTYQNIYDALLEWLRGDAE